MTIKKSPFSHLDQKTREKASVLTALSLHNDAKLKKSTRMKDIFQKSIKPFCGVAGFIAGNHPTLGIMLLLTAHKGGDALLPSLITSFLVGSYTGASLYRGVPNDISPFDDKIEALKIEATKLSEEIRSLG